MATVAPFIAGTTSKVATNTYAAAVSDLFPRLHRKRLVEASIAGRDTADYLPTNLSVNQTLVDRHLEFNIKGQTGVFLDMASLSLETKIDFYKTDGITALVGADRMIPVNMLSNLIFKNVMIFIGDKLVESSPLYSYQAYCKILENFPQTKLNSLGRCCFFINEIDHSGIVDTVTQAFFTNATEFETTLMTNAKTHGVHTCAPLFADIGSLDQYLLDGVDVRIRLELNSNAWVINSDEINKSYSYNITSARLRIDKVKPHLNALLALNDALNKPGASIDYTFTKMINKVYVIPANQTTFISEMPWNLTIPEVLRFIIIDQNTFDGRFNRNPIHFKHGDVSNINIQVNGSPIYNINATFSNQIAHLYYEIYKSISATGNPDNLVTFDRFKAGAAVFNFNLNDESISDAMPIEKSGNLRITLTMATQVNHNRLIMFFGDTIGLLKIFGDRSVLCDLRA